MSTYLQRNPPRAWQWGWTVAGVTVRSVPQVTLHTFEADWTAARGADYIRTRPDSAGYHWLTGLDQSIHVAPWGAGTAHAPSVNTFSKGISCMWFAGRWGQLSAANRKKLIDGMALGAHRYSRWCVSQGLGAVPARKITGTQAKNRQAGFVYHGDLQADRSDPGNDFPLQMFLTEYRRLENGGTTPSTPVLEGDIMSPREFWSYLNKSVDERQVYRILRDTDANARDSQRRIRRADWADWLGTRIGNIRSKPDSALSNRWSLREDGYRLSTWTQYAYLWARRAHDMAQQARNEAREVKAMVRAQAETQDELLQGQGKILEAVENAEREAVRVNAAEVAEELELAVKEDAEADQEDDS